MSRFGHRGWSRGDRLPPLYVASTDAEKREATLKQGRGEFVVRFPVGAPPRACAVEVRRGQRREVLIQAGSDSVDLIAMAAGALGITVTP